MNNKKTKELLNDVNAVIDIWEEELNNYSDEEFGRITNVSQWTIGQLYQHLIIETRVLNLKNIKQSLSLQSENKPSKNIFGRLLFLVKTIPPYKFKIRDVKSNAIQQPSNIEAVRFHLKQLKANIQEVAQSLKVTNNAKTLHPFLGYLNAYEWFELIEIHFRHHLRQKSKIDKALEKYNSKTHKDFIKLLKGKIQSDKYCAEQMFATVLVFNNYRKLTYAFGSAFIVTIFVNLGCFLNFF